MAISSRFRCSLLILLSLSAFGSCVAVCWGAEPNSETCPNADLVGFSPESPDCRGYELVSPPFTNATASVPIAVSGSGGALAVSSGGFAATQSDRLEAYYLVSRTNSGWSASPLGPPSASFGDPEPVALSPASGESLWSMRTRQQSAYALDLFAREADGAFVEVGPMVPPSAEAGAPANTYESFDYQGLVKYVDSSTGFTHVITGINGLGPRWPGDTTEAGGSGFSLYEYSGRTLTHPALVGVSDGGIVVNGETLPPGRVISNCATYLGATGQEELYNAESEDGEHVFFTAVGHDDSHCPGGVAAPAVTELFARVGGVETVPVSEPSAVACKECSTPATAAEGRREGVYVGASRDGSKVFFLSTQALLGKNSMNLYEYDFHAPRGYQVRLVSTGAAEEENMAGEGGAKVLGIARLSEDGSHVYFVANGVLTGGEVNTEGAAAESGADNLYVYQRDAVYPAGKLSFVTTLSAGDSGDWSSSDARSVQASPDGRYAVFGSEAVVTPNAPGGLQEIYEYDSLTGELVRVSRGEKGYVAGVETADANSASIPIQSYVNGAQPSITTTGLALADNGGTVVFEDAAGLTTAGQVAAAAGVKGVYEYRSAGGIDGGEVYEVSDGAEGSGSTFGAPGSGGGTDESGEDIFFETADLLVPGVADTTVELYDARVDGGVQPVSPPLVECAGLTCQVGRGAAASYGQRGSEITGGEALGAPMARDVVKAPGRTTSTAVARARKLAAALRVCRKGRLRAQCEARARKRYGVKRAGGTR